MKIGFVHLGRENLGIEYLSSVAKKEGHEVRLYYSPGLFGQNDNVLYIPSLEKKFDKTQYLIDQVCLEKPDVLCFSVYTTTFTWGLDFAAKVKECMDIPTLFGGLHVTLTTDEVLKHSQVDMAVYGEGEGAFPLAIKALAGKTDPAKVKGLLWRKDGQVMKNPLFPLIKDLDSIPFPDKALFEKDVNFVDDYMVMTNKGCPFSCAYCCESAINKMYDNRFFRRRSTDSVMEELQQMYQRYHFREVMFNDSIFFTHEDWFFELMEKYRRRIRRPFRCFGQVSYLTDEIAKVLMESGCYAIEFGVQTLNETVRKNVLNRNETNQDNSKAFAICDKRKIHYDIDHIFGLPDEKEEDFVFAAKYYSKLKYLNRIKCHFLTYFPGTQIIETALEMGLINKEQVNDINAGKVGDFFHASTHMDKHSLKLANSFHKFFKVLPLIPKSWAEKIIAKKWYNLFGGLPSLATIFLQIIGAIKGRDYRFVLQIKYYALRLRRNWHLLKYNRR